MTSLPLKWYGGKHYLAQRIVKLMPEHTHYVEPYFGGGAVLFAKPADLVNGHSEVINDIDDDLTNFWRTLRDPAFDLFVRWCQATPLSEAEWRLASSPPRQKCGEPDIAAALWFFVRYRQSRQGLGKNFATLSRNRIRRGMNEQASAWLSAVEGLPEAHERLKRVVILNRDAIDVIRQQDGPNTHFYCDPPYLEKTRTAHQCYRHEMTFDQHAALLEALVAIDGTFQLSGYHNGLYDLTAETKGWRRIEFDLPNNASSTKTKERKTECLWMNY